MTVERRRATGRGLFRLALVAALGSLMYAKAPRDERGEDTRAAAAAAPAVDKSRAKTSLASLAPPPAKVVEALRTPHPSRPAPTRAALVGPRQTDAGGSVQPFDEPDLALEFYALKRAPLGQKHVPVERYFVARERMRSMRRFSTKDNRFLVSPDRGPARPGAATATWTPLGPGNIGGRTRVILIDPGRPSVMYAAGASGGVWKTTNAGKSWSLLDDMMANLAVTSLALDPADSQTIYAATGDTFDNVDAVRGAGVFKTTDGGATWTHLASTSNADFYFVNDIVVSPNASTNVYAATWTGVWRSTDGGTNWNSVLAGTTISGCRDLAVRSGLPTDYLFAACGGDDYGPPAPPGPATVYRNTDAAGSGTWDPVLTETNMGRTSLAIAPSDQSIVYALSASIDRASSYYDGLHAVYRSTTEGDSGSWTAQVRNTDLTLLNTLLLTNPPVAVACPDFGSGFLNHGGYDNVIAVDPTDPNRVWVGGVDLFRSDDAGVNWALASYWAGSTSSYAHADQHAIVFHPSYDGTRNQTLLVGNDGGIFSTDNARATAATGRSAPCNSALSSISFTDLNHGYAAAQFYYGVPYPDGNTYFGGTQDNGTVRGSDTGGTDSWSEIWSGDGGAVAVDPTDTNILYVENTRRSIRKSVDGGASFGLATSGITESSADFLFVAPFTMDPGNANRLWTGGFSLWRTLDAATSWAQASAITTGRGSVSAIAVAPTDGNFVLAGMSDGFIHRTSIGLRSTSSTNWPFAQPAPGYVSSLTFDPTDRNVAYATYASFGVLHVWRSTNGGATWTSIDGAGPRGIPDIPAHSIVVDPANPQRLYVGTDLGVFVSTDVGATWAVENTGFGHAVVESLAVTQTQLFAFTHGRGAWRVEISPPPPQPDVVIGDASISEGNGGTQTLRVPVTLSGTPTRPVTVRYSTANDTAMAQSDYRGKTANLTFAAGTATLTQEATITILGDPRAEPDESFFVNLLSATNARIVNGQGLGTITNDDTPGTLSFGSPTYAVSEAGVKATVTVARTGGTSSGVTVGYTTSDGTAKSGSDYSTATGTLTLGPGITSTTFTVSVMNDSLVEGDETVVLRLGAVSGGSLDQGAAVLTITDNEFAGAFRFSRSSYTVSEGLLSTELTVTRSGGSGGPVTVGYQTTVPASGTPATPGPGPGADFTPVSGTLTFNAGQLSRTFTVPIVTDLIDETNETLGLLLSSPQVVGGPAGLATLGSPSTALLTITDNDAGGILQFSTTAYTVDENGESANVLITRTGGLADQVSVTCTATAGSATDGKDFTAGPIVVDFGASETSKRCVVPIQDEAGPPEREGPETIHLALSAATGGATLGARKTALLTINDSDGGVILHFSQPGFLVVEGGAALVTVKRTGSTTDVMTVQYQTTDGTAVSAPPGDADYTPKDGTLTFGVNVTTMAFSVLTTADTRDESDEDVNLRLLNPANVTNPGRPPSLGTQAMAKLSVLDDDAGGVLRFGLASYSRAETGVSATIVVTRTGGVAGDVKVDYATAAPASGTPATANVDFTPVRGGLTFLAGQVSKTFQVPIANDTDDETNETVGLQLTANVQPGGGTIGTPNTALLTIRDDDTGGAIQFGLASYSVAEGVGTANIAVVRSGGVAVNVTVDWTATDGSADGSDYGPAGGTLAFDPGVVSQPIVLTITGDALEEGPESLSLGLTNPMGGATLGLRPKAPVTISDDDTVTPTLHFSAAAYTVSEGGLGVVTVRRSGNLMVPVTLNYATSDGTATLGDLDYMAKSGTLSFGINVSELSFTVMTTADTRDEGNEDVNLTLSMPSVAAQLGSQATAKLNVLDNDAGGAVKFSLASYTVSEALGLATIVVTRTGGVAGPVRVSYETTAPSSGTPATPGADFTAIPPTVLTFGAGQVGKTFTVTLLPDSLDETNETLGLMLSNALDGATLGTPSTATLTISDNDTAGAVKFGATWFSGLESGGAATVTVTRSGGLAGPLTVDYATSDGSATLADSDYQAASGGLTFGPNETTKSFLVPLLDDSTNETNETIQLTLSNVTGGATLGTSSATLYVVDDESMIPPAVNATSSYTLQKTSLYINRQGIRTTNPGTFVHAISYGDFDQDLDVDVFMASGDGTAGRTPFELYLNDGLGNFTLDTTFFGGNPPGMVHPRKSLTGDFNGDGKLEMFVIGHGYDQPPFPGEFPISILSSPGGLILGQSLSSHVGFFHGGASADIDGDGDLDVFVTSTATPFFLINDGTGAFTRDNSRLSSGLRNRNMYTAELIDVDGDDHVDLLVAGHEQDGMSTYVLWGDRTGFYSTAKGTILPAVAGWGTVVDIDAEDIDGDSDRDIVISRSGGGEGGPGFYTGYKLQILECTGGRSYVDATSTRIATGTNPAGAWFDWIRLQDWNADGKPDIIVDDAVRGLIWLNDGFGAFP